MSSILRSLIVRVGADTTKAQSEFKKLAGQLKKQGKEIESAGKSLTRGITVPILGAVAGMGALVASALKTADEFQKLSDVTGLTTERLQELKYAGAKLDIELETITGAQSKLVRAMHEARDGSKDQSDAFKMLGVAVTDSNGNFRDSNVVFAEAIDALSKVENATERDAISLKLFGRGALELNPIIKAGGDELARLTDEAHKNGAVMSGDAIKALDDFGDEMEAMKLSIQTAVQQMAVDMLPTLRLLFNSIKTNVLPMLKKFLDGVAKLIQGFANLSPQMQKFLIFVLGLLAALGPTVTVIGKLYTQLSKVFTMINAATMAIKGGQGLIAALSALLGPAGVVMLAVAAIAILAGIFITASENAKEASREANQFADTLKESSDKFKTNTEAIQDNANVAGQLVNELFELRNKEDKSNEEKQRMVTLVSQINELMPDMNLMIDEQTGLLNLSKNAVLDYIEAREQELLLRAEEEREVELLKERLDIQQKLAQAKIDEADALAAMEEYSSKWHSNMLGGTSYRARIKATGEAVKTYTKALENNTKELESNGAESEKAAQAVDELDYYYEASADSANQATIATQEQTAAAQEMAARTKERLGELRQSWLDYAEQVKSTTQDYIDAMGDLGDDGIQETELTADQIKKNLEKQIEMFKNWRKNIQLLSAKVPKDVMDELEALGPEFAPVIEQLNGMTKTELDAWIATWREKTGLARDAAITEIGTLPSKIKQIGRLSGQGFIDGMNEKLEELNTCATKFGSVVTKRLENVLEIKSPSRVMKKLGKFTGMGFVGGILDTVKNVKNAALTMADATNVLGASPFKSSAVNASAGGTTNNTSGMYTLNVNGSTDPNMVAGIVVQKLRMAGAV